MSLTRTIPMLLLLGASLASCEKKETPIELPPPGTALQATVNMGENYEDQLFYDFENGMIQTSKVNSWDLAFESSPEGFHVFMNGGKDVLVYNCHNSDPGYLNSTSGISRSDWKFDDPSGLPDSTGIGDWRDAAGNSLHEIYLVKLDDKTCYKLQIVSVDAQQYVIRYGDISYSTLTDFIIPKDPNQNFTYFSFADGIVYPEPPKNTWDIVFTRYRHIYKDLNNAPYPVTGVLLNAFNTEALADSTTDFDEINASLPSIASGMFLPNRDVIGFDWKTYNFSTMHYEVNPQKCYVVRNRRGELWKIHFLDFYSPQGMKGSPSFEFERIQ